MRTPRPIAKLVESIEHAEFLDRPSAAVNSVLSKVLQRKPVEDVLSGVPFGHPLHPALVAVPIGAWSSALVLDAAGEPRAARTLVGLGIVSAVPTAASGGSDWLTTDGAERRVGAVHALLNYAALGLFGASWRVRRHNHAKGVALSGAGAVLVSVAGWLGGHLTYAQGVGVDTTAFQRLPGEWTDVGAVDDLPASGTLGSVTVDGVPLLLTRVGDDVVAIADRCTHRGAPLHEGELDGDCVVCPWHGSAFDLRTGAVRSGPATRPQPTLETRTLQGRVQVRRLDPRTLPTRSTGARTGRWCR